MCAACQLFRLPCLISEQVQLGNGRILRTCSGRAAEAVDGDACGALLLLTVARSLDREGARVA